MPSTDPIQKLITNLPVKETVASAQAIQSEALSKVKDIIGQSGNLMGGMSSFIANAQNVLSESVSGIVSNITDSVKGFAETVNTGLTTTLTDLSKKSGSMISEIGGKVNAGAVAEKLSFIVNTADNSISSTSIFGKSGAINDLMSNFSSGQLGKMMSATGLSSIVNNSDITNAVSSVSESLSGMTSSAKSIVGDVLAMPNKAVSTITSTVNDTLGGLISQVSNSVSNTAKATGIGDLSTLISDTYALYSQGRAVYDAVSGKDPSMVVGIASKLNNSFPQVQNILNTASTICSAINGKYIQNYAANKDIMDLLLMRMANSGMYGAINQLMNCSDTQQYVTEDTYFTLANQLATSVSNGDVHTASTIHSYAGNSRISNAQSLMYNLAYNIDDNNEDEITEYNSLLSNMKVSSSGLFGTNYVSNTGSSMYVYNANNVRNMYRSSPNLTNVLLGNSTVGKIANGILSIL